MKRVRRVAAVGLVVGAGLVLSMTGPAEPEAEAEPQGDLRAADPTLVRDGDRWLSLSTNEALGPANARPCDPNDPVWADGKAYVPYRVGPAPDELGDCWAGDALPDGPGPWANHDPGVFMQWAPSIANIDGVWYLFYASQLAGTGQQCIGAAASNSPTGPGWIHQDNPLICPGGGNWAIDPEIWYDRQTRAWYLLWRQDPDACDSFLHIRQFDPATGTLTGPERRLMTATRPELGFDEIGIDNNCADGNKDIIENPTMVRADNGELWLFFSANQWDSINYATGWALCGTGSPVEGAECALVNALPGSSRNSPIWGSSQRTAVTPEDPKPYEAFPDLPGFGGMSLATSNPTAGEPQPVYATSHIWHGGDLARTQVVHRLDTSGDVPHLTEPAASIVADATEIGTVEQNPVITGRDGVTTTRFGDTVFWSFGDTVLTVPGADGPYSTNLYWASNTLSWTADLNASDGITLENDYLDAENAPTEFLPLTDVEREYNLAHKPDANGDCAEPPCGAEYVLWPGTMVPDPDRDRILVFYGKVSRGGGQGGYSGLGIGIAVLDPETKQAVRPELRPGEAEPTLAWPEGGVKYKNAVVVDDTLYAFGMFRADGSATIDNYVARVPLADATDLSAWRYYAGEQDGAPVWSPDPDAAEIVMSGGNDGGSVSYVPYLDKYLAVYRPFLSSDQVGYRTAPNPWGPWSDEAPLFTMRPGTNRAVYAHPEYASADGRTQYVFYYHEEEPDVAEIRIVEVRLEP
jgi:Glycosyl hydrolases family 43/Domain of unknown function (DUF4185)